MSLFIVRTFVTNELWRQNAEFHYDKVSLLVGKGRPAREADNLTAICESLV
jgi:hypothetical protein